jgi:hypothetical protein
MRDSELDLPTDFSFGMGQSIVPPQSTLDVGSPAWIDETTRAIRALRDEALQKRDWERFVFLHMRDRRWQALWEVALQIPQPTALGHLFRRVWVDSEDTRRNRAVIRKLVDLLGQRQGALNKLFTPGDVKMFKKLPEKFQIYRGAKSWNLSGMSWTLDVQRAVIFARFTITDGCEEELAPDRLGVVMEKTVSKSESRVLFCTDDRHEDEIVLRRSEKGPESPEGMLWVSEYKGVEAFATEFLRRRQQLSQDAVSIAAQKLASWAAAGTHP